MTLQKKLLVLALASAMATLSGCSGDSSNSRTLASNNQDPITSGGDDGSNGGGDGSNGGSDGSSGGGDGSSGGGDGSDGGGDGSDGGGDGSDGGGDGSNGGGDGGDDDVAGSSVEDLVVATADTAGGLGTTVVALGDGISQQDTIPQLSAFSQPAGTIVSESGEAVGDVSMGLGDGLGSLSTNDNALGTTLAGVANGGGELGQATSAGGDLVSALGTLPVVMQVENSTQLVTKLGTTVNGLGGKITVLSDRLSVNFEDSSQVLGGTTTKLTAYLRPVVVGTDGKVTRVSRALVLPAQAGNLLVATGGTLGDLGARIGERYSLLEGVGDSVTGGGDIVIAAGGLLGGGSAGDGAGEGLLGGGKPAPADGRTDLERGVASGGQTGTGVGEAVTAIGTGISQQPLGEEGRFITDGAGNVVINTGEAVGSLSSGVSNGIGDISNNPNALGTTLAGTTGAVAEGGQVVSSAGSGVAALNRLPVVMQVDQATGAITQLGGSLEQLGGGVTQAGDTLTLGFHNSDSHLGGLTSELSAVVRPVVLGADDGTTRVSQALVVGPEAGRVLLGAGGSLSDLGSNLATRGELASALGTTVAGLGNTVGNTGRLLGGDEASLLSSLGDSGLSGLGANDLLGASDNGLSDGLGGAVDGLGGSSDAGGPVAGLTTGLSDTLGGATDGSSAGSPGGSSTGASAGLVSSVTNGLSDTLGGSSSGSTSGSSGGLLTSVADGLSGALGGAPGASSNRSGGNTTNGDGATPNAIGSPGDLTAGATGGNGSSTGGDPSATNDNNDRVGLVRGLLGGLGLTR